MAGYPVVNALWRQESDVFSASEGTPFASGQLGKVAWVQSTTGLDAGQAPKVVQYVKRRSTDALTLNTGQAVYWADLDNFLVTDTQSAAIGGTTNPYVAGFVQSTNPQPGSFGFIQVGGQGLNRVSDSTSASTTSQGRPLVAVANQTFGFVKPLLQGATAGTDATTLFAQLSTTGQIGSQTIGVLTVGNNATTTNLTVEALINVVRHSW